MSIQTIPVIVGITGHRNIVDEDKPKIKARVIESLREIQTFCKSTKKNGKDTPIIMLNGFAQGADMLCAEAAFELGIDVYAVLPREEDKYLESFDNQTDKQKLHGYIQKAKRVILAPDMEKNKEWLQTHSDISDDSYEYRQLGIYIAEHSHILIALWDGNSPKTQFGCGTYEVIKFALEHNYLNREHLFTPGLINDTAVVWIKSRRQGDGSEADIRKTWLTSNLAERSGRDDGNNDHLVVSNEPPAFLRDIIKKTVKYNEKGFTLAENKVKLWKETQELDDYRKSLRYHYAKADERSYNGNQTKYLLFLRLLAIAASLVALTFLIYDDASLSYMIFPCTVLIGIIVVLNLVGARKAYHKDYIEYRAFAEALRIQFYLSICSNEIPVADSVCELYSWGQKVEFVWIDKAVRALSVLCEANRLAIDSSKAIETWIGTSVKPKGQLQYHREKIKTNTKMARRYDILSKCLLGTTLLIYAAILVLEISAYVYGVLGANFFWNGNFAGSVSWRNFGAIVLGAVAAAALLFSSYWGKLSYDRKASDNDKMGKFYAAAYERWQKVKDRSEKERELFLKEIAREEIIENGIWYSYVNENRLEIDI